MCPLIGKQILVGISNHFIPCEHMVIENDACFHGKKLINYDPVNWNRTEFPTDLDQVAELDELKNISYCKTCTAKNNLSEFEIKTKKLMIFFSVSNKCNLSCRMCNPIQSHNLKKEYNIFENENLLDEVKDLTGYYFNNDYSISVSDDHYDWIFNNGHKIGGISVTGGEPLYNKKYLNLLKHFDKQNYAKDINLRIYTNGTLFNEENIDLLNKFKNVYLYVSIDGVYDTYEYIRDGSDFNLLQNSVDLLHKKLNFRELHLVMTVNVINVFNIKDFQTWAERYDNIELNYIEVYPNYRGIGLQNLSENLIDDLIQNIDSPIIHNMLNRAKSKPKNKRKLLRELKIFDKVKNQNYHNVASPKLLKYLDETYC